MPLASSYHPQNQTKLSSKKKTGTNLYDHGFGNTFLDMTPKAQATKENGGNSLMVQQLGFHALTTEGLCPTPSQGTKIPQATQHGQTKQTYGASLVAPW